MPGLHGREAGGNLASVFSHILAIRLSSGESPVVFLAGWFSPMQEPWGPGYPVSLALAIASYCLCHLQGGQLPLSLWFFTPLAGLVFPRKLLHRGC